MARTKVLLDTDIGTDSDDALCLMYLLAQRECELVGITTVGVDAADRAAVADALCHHVGRDQVPIAAGADRPLAPSPYWHSHRVNQVAILDRWPARRSYPPDQALDLMRRVIHDNPGQVVLITVGMLTNLALLAAVDPAAVGKLRGIYTMTGRLQPCDPDMRPECNTMLDPGASMSIFSRGLANHRVVGLNVTAGRAIDLDQARAMFAGERFDPLIECGRCWGEQRKRMAISLHDPATTALVFRPDLATWRRGRIGIKLFDHKPGDSGEVFPEDQMLAATYFEPDPGGPHAMADASQGQAIQREVTDTVASLG